MASYTTNLNLKKPAGSENVAIGDINNNMDTIDAAYGTLNSNLAAITTGPNVPSDLNSINKTGICYTNNTASNRPADWCIVYTFAYDNVTKAQLAFQVSSNHMYYRRYNSGWQAWNNITMTVI